MSHILLTARTKEYRDYWTARLADVARRATLVTDLPRPRIYAPRKDAVALPLASGCIETARAVSGGDPFLQYAAVVGAVKACLYRASGAPLVVTGSPALAAAPPGAAPVVNALAIADLVEHAVPFGDLLLRVCDTLREAYARQDHPYAQLIDDLHADADATRSPLFDVIITMHGLHEALPDLPHDVRIELRLEDGRLAGDVLYNPRLTLRSSAEWFAARVAGILLAGLTSLDTAIGDLPALTTAEAQQLASWNATSRPEPEETVTRRVARIARQQPDAIACVDGDIHVSYASLSRGSAVLAARLREAGIGTESVVAITMQRSARAIEGLLGILTAGAAYVPLDPGLPLERGLARWTDSGATVAIVGDEPAAWLPDSVTRLSVDATSAHRSRRGSPAHDDPETLAYVLYTSGSTGAPKGVAMPHRALVNLIVWQEQLSGADAARTLQYARLSFDVSFQEIFSTLCAGATLVMARDEIRADPAALMSLIQDEALTRLFLPVVALNQLAAAAETGSLALPALREIVTAGEQLHISPAIARLFRALPGCVLRNHYGPTEAHVVSNLTLSGPASRWPALPTIGTPIANTALHVLDPRLRQLPIGAAGHLHIGGTAVSRGYWRDPALTAAKFVPDPCGDRPGARLYATGDLARHLAAGEIEFQGRIDRQLKIRGYRVEPAEVEAALRTHGNVREAAVIAWEDQGGHKRLVAYIVPRAGASGADVYRQHLQTRLPEPLIPALYVHLDALPLTSSGKVDRARLPAPDPSRQEAPTPAAETTATGIEAVLAKIWAETLSLPSVGLHDNFFGLGGDSILVIQVVTRARREGLRLAPRQLFQHQTVAALAKVAGTPAIGQTTAAAAGPVPLTPIQQWFFGLDSPNPHHFNMAYLVEAARPIRAPVVEEATRRLIEHHAALRLRFRQENGVWVQEEGHEVAPTPFTVVDLSDRTDAEIDEPIWRETSRLGRSLHVTNGPLFQVALFDLGDTRPARLFVVAHHLAVDGVSWRMLFEDLSTLCDSEAKIRTLPAATTPFSYWASRLSSHAASEHVSSQLRFWLEALAGPVAALPLDTPGAANLEQHTRTMTMSLSAEETGMLLRDAVASDDVRINDLLLTALARAFRAWTGASDLAVDIEGHGREEFHEDLDVTRTAGWFTSLVPLRLAISPADDRGEDLRLIQKRIRALPDHGVGYGLLRYLHPDPRVREQLAAIPPAKVSFNYLGQFDHMATDAPLFRAARERIGRLVDPLARRSHELYINGFVTQNRLSMRFTFSEAQFREATIVALADAYMRELRELAIWCRVRRGPAPGDFPLVALEPHELEDVLAAVSFGTEVLS